jgi:hypothetical protein
MSIAPGRRSMPVASIGSAVGAASLGKGDDSLTRNAHIGGINTMFSVLDERSLEVKIYSSL